MKPTTSLCVAALALSMFGCAGAKARYSSSPVHVSSGSTVQKLERSVFARDPNGQLSEQAIQDILASPLELDLPARVGVLPIVDAADWRGPGPSYDMAPASVAPLVNGLRGTEPFTLVTEMLPIPSGALGMEALREMAARYQLRYVLLYREKVATRERANAWAIGYATLVGALFLPGDTLSVDGYVEASLFDVKTGILVYTVRRRVTGTRKTNVWHTGDKLEYMQRKAAVHAAPDLAKDVRKATYRFAEAARVENGRRFADSETPPATPAAPTEAAAPATTAAGDASHSAGQAM